MKLTMLEKEVPMDEIYPKYVDVKKFTALCEECPEYGKSWSCPPIMFDVDKVWQSYSRIHICLLKMDIEPTDDPAKIYDMFRGNQHIISAKIYDMEEATPGSRALIPGPCDYCGEGNCARLVGKPCRIPAYMRNSMVSMSADCSATARDFFGLDLEWPKDGKPPAFMSMFGALLIK